MSDTDTQETLTGNQGLIPLQVNVQYIKDFSFENPRAPLSLQPNEEQPNVEVNVDVNAQKVADTAFEVALAVTVKAENAAGPMFLIELSYAGLFTLNGIPEEHLGPVLLIECPRLLFPFARSIIADATREGGYSPLLIQPIDFADLYRRTQEQKQAEAAAQAGDQSPPSTDTIQ